MENEDLGLGDLFEQPTVKKDWLATKQFVLGTSDNLVELIDACIQSGKYALDLETTGLDNRLIDINGSKRTVDQIAGVCLSPDGVRGYYIPLRHRKSLPDGTTRLVDCNVPLDVFDREFRRLMKATEEGKTVAIFHNAKFDQEFLEFNGTGEPYSKWDAIKTWHDTMILAFLQDSRRRVGLKELSNKILGIEQLKLDDVFPENYEGPKDFTLLDPENIQTVWYAAGDAICTWLLCEKILPDIINPDIDGLTQKTIYDIERACTLSVRWMERNRIHIDRVKVKELILLGHKEWYDCIWDVYQEASRVLGRDVTPGFFKYLKEKFVFDEPTNPITMQKKAAENLTEKMPEYKDDTKVYPKVVKNESKNETIDFPATYDITNPPEIGMMLLEIGVPDLPRTEKSGQVKTSAEVLDYILEGHEQEYPFVKKVQRFREINKALSTYLYTMYNDSDPIDDTMRIGFQQLGTDTGRFNTRATNKGMKMVGWPAVNLQSIPRAGGGDRPECMQRLRECINSRKSDSFIVAVDFSGVELRIVTNLSREPLWLNEFFRCSSCGREFDKGDGLGTPNPPPSRCPNCGSDKIGDLHTLTALNVYGKDAQTNRADEWKELRGNAKGANFSLCYGGSGNAVCRSTGVDKNEGKRIEQQFKSAYKGLQVWWGNTRAGAKTNKFVRTAFYRKYPVPDIDNGDGGLRSKAERNAINGPVQGSSADITKAAMSFIYKKMRDLGWLDKVRMIITMHDELVFDIDGDVLEKAIAEILPLMTRNGYVLSKKWPIPLTCDVEMGHDWSVPWDLNSMRYKEVRFVGNKKYKDAKKLPEGQKWEVLPTFPDDLKSFFEVETQVVEIPKEKPPVVEQMSLAPVEISPILAVPANGLFEYKLKEPLKARTLRVLADVIIRCKGRGTHQLKVLTQDGVDLTAVLYQHKPFYGKPVNVNANEFYYLANAMGL